MYGEQQARVALCGGGRRKRAEQGLVGSRGNRAIDNVLE